MPEQKKEVIFTDFSYKSVCIRNGYLVLVKHERTVVYFRVP
jgi:hypothetical protein